jgi:hypothetical protein
VRSGHFAKNGVAEELASRASVCARISSVSPLLDRSDLCAPPVAEWRGPQEVRIMSSSSALAVVFASVGPQGEVVSPEALAPLEARWSFHWGDFDGDALEDALVVSLDGQAQLLRNRGDGTFEDVSTGSGLAPLQGVTLGAWGDYDADGKLDLFVGRVRAGARLFKNLGGTFEALDSGLAHAAADLAAQWVDYDQDGLADLWIEIESGALLYHNFGATSFELVEMPLAAEIESGTGAIEGETTGVAAPETGRFRRPRPGAPGLRPGGAFGTPTASSVTIGATPMNPTVPAAPSPVQWCAPGVVDVSTSNCVSAASVPALGKLYPLGPEFSISAAGKVGVNTTTPLYRLHVIETAGIGVFGQGGTTGVRGDANLVGSGNRFGGEFTASGGSNNIGVRGSSTIGVHGIGLSGGYGVLGENNSGSSTGVYGRANHATSVTTGVLGEVTSPNGTAIKGVHLANTGTPAAIEGITNSTTLGTAAIRGTVNHPAAVDTIAVEGVSEPQPWWGIGGSFRGGFIGVDGSALLGGTGDRIGGYFGATGGDGENVGVKGVSSGTGTLNAGVEGQGWSTDSIGVVGSFGPSIVALQSGVSGSTNSATGSGVYGYTSTSPAAIRGMNESQSGLGVWGEATATSPSSAAIGVGGSVVGSAGAFFAGVSGAIRNTGGGVYAMNAGVAGTSEIVDGAGVYGYALNATTGANWGVFGQSQSTQGVPNPLPAAGVVGWTDHASFSDTIGVWGVSTPQPNWGYQPVEEGVRECMESRGAKDRS